MTLVFISYWPELIHVDAHSWKGGSEICPDKHQGSVTESKGRPEVTFATGNRTVRAADGLLILRFLGSDTFRIFSSISRL